MAENQGAADVMLAAGKLVISAQTILNGEWEGPYWFGVVYIGIPDAYEAVCDENERDAALGLHVRKALLASEVGRQPEDYGFTEEHPWGDPKPKLERLAAQLNVRKSELKRVTEKSVPVEWVGPDVTFTPLRRTRRGFDNFNEGDVGHEDVVVPWLSSDEELGRALRLALDRCA